MSSPVVADMFLCHTFGGGLPLSMSSDKTKPCAKLGCKETAKVPGYETSSPLVVFSSQTHISSLKLGLMLSV